jgi:hypothetical protein
MKNLIKTIGNHYIFVSKTNYCKLKFIAKNYYEGFIAKNYFLGFIGYINNKKMLEDLISLKYDIILNWYKLNTWLNYWLFKMKNLILIVIKKAIFIEYKKENSHQFIRDFFTYPLPYLNKNYYGNEGNFNKIANYNINSINGNIIFAKITSSYRKGTKDLVYNIVWKTVNLFKINENEIIKNLEKENFFNFYVNLNIILLRNQKSLIIEENYYKDKLILSSYNLEYFYSIKNLKNVFDYYNFRLLVFLKSENSIDLLINNIENKLKIKFENKLDLDNKTYFNYKFIDTNLFNTINKLLLSMKILNIKINSNMYVKFNNYINKQFFIQKREYHNLINKKSNLNNIKNISLNEKIKKFLISLKYNIILKIYMITTKINFLLYKFKKNFSILSSYILLTLWKKYTFS